MLLTDQSRWQARFPNPERAPADGLLAYGGDLEPQTLLAAYSQGIFPWYSEGDPILWWSPDPRCILFLDAFHISARSRRKIRNSGFQYSVDRAFKEVMQSCSQPREEDGGTWLLPEMQTAYGLLHELGFAHSVEIWQSKKLVGGIYGVSLGNAFFGESMFRLVPEASRAALLCLVTLMKQHGFSFLDCQLESPHMLAMGATEIPRKQFLEMVAYAAQQPSDIGKWEQIKRALAPIDNMIPLGFETGGNKK